MADNDSNLWLDKDGSIRDENGNMLWRRLQSQVTNQNADYNEDGTLTEKAMKELLTFRDRPVPVTVTEEPIEFPPAGLELFKAIFHVEGDDSSYVYSVYSREIAESNFNIDHVYDSESGINIDLDKIEILIAKLEAVKQWRDARKK